MGTGGGAGPVETGREAYARGDWRTAYTSLGAAGPSSLAVDDLEALARSAWWLGLVKENLELSEEVFHRRRAASSPEAAAMTALELGLQWVLRGDVTVGSGWVSRARRILRDVPEGPAHGYLHYLEAAVELEFAGVLSRPAYPEQLQDMGRRFGEPALVSLGLVLSGLANLRAGSTDVGFAELDEAMLPVLADRVPLVWVGDIYCTVIHLCHELADYRRMLAWTAATERWCARVGNEVMYSGVCRVHRLELMSIEGGWDEVEPRIEQESEQLAVRNVWAAGEGFYQLGELRRLRGDPTGARTAYDRAESLGIDPQPGRTLLDFAAGRSEQAWSALSSSLGSRHRIGRVRLLPAGVEIALATGRTAQADALAAELETVAGQCASPGFEAWAASARGMVLLSRRRPAGALEALERAARFYRSIGARHDLGRVLLWQGSALEELGRGESARRSVAAAEAIFRELGAAPVAVRHRAASAPGGLTAREVEVLGAVAAGSSNRDVAAQLFISEKTVGRHLANIFVKIGVSSRTAAAAWAHDHGLARLGSGAIR
ncbi:helix-turn-helix transcriptional regulator [Arthrobacter sp. B0490]|uniref:helix-turn-helix transcriptional regulator n=1 Tax=Arthrobacter sp. B0490 TaxID=2058891 RepID=UPI000CE40205|nr:helix-turn-helix transcriptional regulator [Arthrobacter sp. B0490]